MADRKIGKYTYSDRHELGRGMFANVYLAKCRQGDEVAIKLFFRESRQSFIRELEIYQHIGNLNHPHILRFEDKGEEDGQPYIVFQQAQEETLRDQIKQMSGKPFGTERALVILRQICSAIIAIHDENINVIHGDIKPENILFDKNNQALLADFGIAVRLPSKDEKVFRPSPQGDPLYMALERFGVDSLLTKESDQYSLGCIAYELFVGRHPLGLVTPQEVAHKIHTTKYGNPCEYNQLLPDFIEKPILKALAKNKRDRYKSVQEFIDALTETPAVIGYGKRYPDKKPLEDLKIPEKGYFKHLTDFLAARGNEYTIEYRTIGKKYKYTYTHISNLRSEEGYNFLYIPV
jgi:serine/threonine protein kinase